MHYSGTNVPLPGGVRLTDVGPQGCGGILAINICSLLRGNRMRLCHETGKLNSCLVITTRSDSFVLGCGPATGVLGSARSHGCVVGTVHCISRIVACASISGVMRRISFSIFMANPSRYRSNFRQTVE